MSFQMQIYRAKPNPAGKDRIAGIASQQQLLSEWVDLKNVGDQSANLSIIALADRRFTSSCAVIDEASIYWRGNSLQSLAPGQIIRVHTGRSSYSPSMSLVDQTGVTFHVYAESGNFVLNNHCGDVLSVWWWNSGERKWEFEDKASYDPEPPEGVILVRNGALLVPSSYAVL